MQEVERIKVNVRSSNLVSFNVKLSTREEPGDAASIFALDIRLNADTTGRGVLNFATPNTLWFDSFPKSTRYIDNDTGHYTINTWTRLSFISKPILSAGAKAKQQNEPRLTGGCTIRQTDCT